ncbi:hypothetical protein D3C72_1241040 [compost metagenome]
MLALAVRHHGRQDHQLGVLGQGERGIHHLGDALRLERDVVVRAVGRAGAGEQQAQVVVDLGDRAHGGTRVVAGGLLLDRDGRGEALDQVDIGLLHQLQELAGVGGQRFDVAALALGIERVERQRRLAGPRQPRDHDELVARQVEVDVLQVVGTRPTDLDFFHIPISCPARPPLPPGRTGRSHGMFKVPCTTPEAPPRPGRQGAVRPPRDPESAGKQTC